VWDKWNALKHRVAKLEGQVQYLRNVLLPPQSCLSRKTAVPRTAVR
jgi:hypothetical protein